MSENQPAANAAGAFPAAASANKSVFFKADGTPKSVRDVYDWALKQPSTSRALDAQAGDTPAAAPITNAPTVVSGDYANSSSWTAMQLYSATDTSSLAALASLPQSPFAVTSDVVEMLGKMHAPTTPGHPHRMQ
jgi:hypothetical protein